MPDCMKTHLEKVKGKNVVIPHYYIAGHCIRKMSVATKSFLTATFPFFHGETVEKSRKFRSEMFNEERI